MSKMGTLFGSALAIGLLFLVLPACSKGAPESNPQPSKPNAGPNAPAGTQPRQANLGRPGKKASSPPGLQKELAKGTAREHPFVPQFDMNARSERLVTNLGTLTLKAIIFGKNPMAIIQHKQRLHVVKEGGVIGNISITEIKESEVILQAANSMKVLSLYDK